MTKLLWFSEGHGLHTQHQITHRNEHHYTYTCLYTLAAYITHNRMKLARAHIGVLLEYNGLDAVELQ